MVLLMKTNYKEEKKLPCLDHCCYLVAGHVLLLQVVQILLGQMFYEYKVSVSDYNKSFIKNVQGKNWCMVWFYWILPISPNKLPGDGSHYLEVKRCLSSSHAGKKLKSL